MKKLQVAKIILAQLGGGRFISMTGAKNLIGFDDALSFQLSSTMTKNRANRVCITLGADDLYKVEFSRYSPSALKSQQIECIEGLYADQLRDIFEDRTGLATSL